MAAERGDNELTIDELAQRTGMTVRNIRAHQSRGLLPAPSVKGRIGYYDDRHVHRLELIQQLQADGFNLTAIQRLVERAEHSGDEIGNLRSLILAPFNDEPAEVVKLSELSEQFGVAIDPAWIDMGVQLGIIVRIDDDTFEVLSPTMMRAGIQALVLGIPQKTLFDVISQVRKHTRAVADVFTKMVDDEIVRPFEERGFQADEWPQVSAAIEGLRPLAAEVLRASFTINMNESAEDAFGRVLARVARDGKRRGSKAKSAVSKPAAAAAKPAKAKSAAKSAVAADAPAERRRSSRATAKASANGADPARDSAPKRAKTRRRK